MPPIDFCWDCWCVNPWGAVWKEEGTKVIESRHVGTILRYYQHNMIQHAYERFYSMEVHVCTYNPFLKFWEVFFLFLGRKWNCPFFQELFKTDICEILSKRNKFFGGPRPTQICCNAQMKLLLYLKLRELLELKCLNWKKMKLSTHFRIDLILACTRLLSHQSCTSWEVYKMCSSFKQQLVCIDVIIWP